MASAPRSLALASGLALALTGLTASASAASTHTLKLHGTMMATHSTAAAVITQTSAADYKITITTSNLPAPAMIHVKGGAMMRVYVAWASDGNRMVDMGMAAPIPLHAASAGTYTGTRVVMLRQVARVFVTAEGSAMKHTPSMGSAVLDSGMMH